MKILRAYKTELDPTRKQAISFSRHAGAARWAFNWGMERKQSSYAAWVAGGRREKRSEPSAFTLQNELVLLKRLPVDEGGVPWLRELSKCAPCHALRNLDRAYEDFFRRCKRGVKHKGFPHFKSKKRGVGSFTLDGSLLVGDSIVKLPRIGRVRLKERGYLPVSGVKILSATVSEKAGRWFVSLQVEQESAFAPEGSGIIGVDVGIKSLAMTSDGEVFDNPKALQCANKRVRLAQKAVARKIKGSNNRRKAVRRLARQNYRVTCVRQDAIHKATTAITKQASVIVIESLSVVGMMKNRHLAQAIGDAGLSEIHRQLRYKAEWRGAVVVEADRFFPSSKMCSECGHVKDALLLSERVYICEVCGLVIDRDLNASINLKNLAGSSPVSACRPGSAGRDQSVAAKLLVGQEPSRERAHV